MSGDGEIERRLDILITLVEAVARDVDFIKTELADIKAVQTRHSSRLSLIDTYLDEQGSAIDGLMRP